MVTTAPAFTLDIDLHPVGRIQSCDDLVRVILDETSSQVQRMQDGRRLADDEDLDDFELGCNALNFARVMRRIREEFPDIPHDILQIDLADKLAAERDYDVDDSASIVSL